MLYQPKVDVSRHFGAKSRPRDDPLLYGQTQLSKTEFTEKVKIISANVNGYRSREGEIHRYIENIGKNCIMALSDTRLRKNVGVKCITDYCMIRSDKTMTSAMATAGGVALIIPKKWSCIRIDLKNSGDGYESIAAIILPTHPNAKPLKILCVYNHPGYHLPISVLQEFKSIRFNNKNIGGLLVGDFNCPHPAFGSRTSNEFGCKLLQAVNDENLTYFNTQSPTYYSNATGLPNVLDLVIADRAGSRLVESCYVEGDIGSDHLPVVTTLLSTGNVMTKNRTDISQWASLVDKCLETYEAPENIEEKILKLNVIVKEARETIMREYTPRKRFLPQEI